MAESKIRHGLQYIPRGKQPSMFQILTWKDQYSFNPKREQTSPNPKTHRFTEIKVYQKPQYQPFAAKEEEHQKEKAQNKYSSKIHQSKSTHIINHDLYFYGENREDPKNKNKRQDNQKSKKILPIKKKDDKKLNILNAQDKKQIETRVENFKKYNIFSREMPNSAFTTYFGKPAFEHYGIGAIKSDLKTHNVMPHAGANHPEKIQTHENALKKANVINNQNTIPRKPVHFGENADNHGYNVQTSEYYNVQIEKHDLINHVRFKSQDHSIKSKAKTPNHNEINHLPKRKPLIVKQKSKKSPKKYLRVKSQEKHDDGLKFMNERDNFKQILQKKKQMNNRIAYKPTQCYPLDWQHQTSANSSARERQQKWNKVKPAGIICAKSVDAKCLIYRK